ncbi:MAG: protein phosphatase 2C domain-containing protein [Anaerolineaceae bacterium]|nr:protein phosphatase 2C domain-containing protein [Anaerolineaceae bacterium]
MEQRPIETPQASEIPQPLLERSWRAVGAVVRGVAHERLALPCQDVQGWQILPSGILLAVVADGAGTARFSDQGARAAVGETLRFLAAALEDSLPDGGKAWEDLLADAFCAAQQVVLDLADTEGEKAREYACTLAAVAATPEGLVAGQIGDGAVVCQEENGTLFAATRLQRGEYANETHFLVQEDALAQASIEFFDRPLNALAVMSDGLIRLALKMPSQEPHSPFFQPLFRFAASGAGDPGAETQLALFLGSARVNERTDDDKALVLAVLTAGDSSSGVSGG